MLSQFARFTDGRTDGRTDRQTTSLDRVCIVCSAVETHTRRSAADQAFEITVLSLQFLLVDSLINDNTKAWQAGKWKHLQTSEIIRILLV